MTIGIKFNSLVIGIKENNSLLPLNFDLKQYYANPFNQSTTIWFDIPKALFITLKVYNLLGQEIATLVNKNMNPVRYEINFDVSSISSGVYFYKLTTNDFTITKIMIIIK